MTIAVIGATGKLGRALMTMPNTISCPIRFEDADRFGQWFEGNKDVDTVWHVARTCRKKGTRRDFNTFMLELIAMENLLKTRAKDCRFIYASTKVVYGLTDDDVAPVKAKDLIRYFVDTETGVYNCPTWKDNHEINLKNLARHHAIYAITKLACERLIGKHCYNYKILRIWDIE